MGKLIIFEGLDGSGKGTQAALTAQKLRQRGVTLRQVTFPDYDSESSALVKMYLSGRFGQKPDDVNAYAASCFMRWTVSPAIRRTGGRFTARAAWCFPTGIPPPTPCISAPNCRLPSGTGSSTGLFDFEYKKIGIPEPDLVLYLAVDPEVSQKLLETVTTANESKKDIQEKDREYMARSRAAAEYCARTLGWQRIECTCAGRAMRPVEEINAEILAKTDRIL